MVLLCLPVTPFAPAVVIHAGLLFVLHFSVIKQNCFSCTVFRFTASIFLHVICAVFSLISAASICLQIIYFNTYRSKDRPSPVVTIGRKTVDFWLSSLTIKLLSDSLLRNWGGGGGGGIPWPRISTPCRLLYISSYLIQP